MCGCHLVLKTTKSVGARGDVQNFGGCQAPAAPVLTQALLYHVLSELKNTARPAQIKKKNIKPLTHNKHLILLYFLPASYIICFRQNRKATLFLIKGSCSPNEMRTSIHKLLQFIKLPNTHKHVWAGI